MRQPRTDRALRTGPDSDAALIAKLAPNAQVTIIGTVGDWVKVYAPSVDSDGYVYGAYLSKSKQASSSKPASTAYDERNEIAKLYNGETVKVLNSNVNGSGYAKVYAPSVDKTGYVNAEYLR